MTVLGRFTTAIAERRSVLLGSGLVCLLLLLLATTRLYSFRASAVDTTVIAHALWRLAHGFNDITTTTGFSQLAEHPSPSMLLFLPAFKLGGGVGVSALLAAQAASVAALGIGLWKLAAQVGLSRVARLSVWAVTLLNPVFWVQAWNAEFHMTTLALGPLVWAISSASSRRGTVAYVVVVTFGAGLRPELAISLVLAGILLMRRGDRRGQLVVIASLLVLAVEAVMVALNGGGGASIQAHLGLQDGESIGALLSRPATIVRPLLSPVMLVSLAYWISVFGLVPSIRGMKWLVIGLPMAAIPMLGVWPWADLWLAHYWQPLFLASGVAAIFGMRRLRARETLGFCVVMFVALFVSWAGIGSEPSREPHPESATGYVRELQSRPLLSVSAPPNLAATLVGRPKLWLYPRPFESKELEWGPFPRANDRPDVVLDTAAEPLSETDSRGYVLVAVCGNTRVWERAAGVLSGGELSCKGS